MQYFMHIFIFIWDFQNLSCDRSHFIYLYHLSYYYTCAEIIRCLFYGIMTMIGHLSYLINECTKKGYISFYIAKESLESHVWVHLNFITNLWNFAKCVDGLLMNTMGIIGKSMHHVWPAYDSPQHIMEWKAIKMRNIRAYNGMSRSRHSNHLIKTF